MVSVLVTESKEYTITWCTVCLLGDGDIRYIFIGTGLVGQHHVEVTGQSFVDEGDRHTGRGHVHPER